MCVTTNVNTQCCTDRGSVGEWFFPNGSIVPRNSDPGQIVRTGRTNQVRLNFRTQQISPTGEYTCVVPETGASTSQTAGIRLVTGRWYTCTDSCKEVYLVTEFMVEHNPIIWSLKSKISRERKLQVSNPTL